MNNIKYVSGVTVYNVNVEDDIIYIDTSASPVTVVLPNIQNSQITLIENKTFTISDFTNNAANNNISIVANGNTVNSNQLTAINSNNGSAFATIVGVSSWQVVTDNPITNGLTYMGTWNANTNTPTLVSSVGIGGQYYIVSVSGTTNLNGVTDWNVGDWAVFIDGTTNVWQKVDNHEIQSYNFIQNEGVTLPQQSTLDFQGTLVNATNSTGKTIATIDYTVAAIKYGSFYSTETQTATANQQQAMTYNNSFLSNGVVVNNNLSGKPTRITVSKTTIYNLQFSAQLNRTGGGSGQQIYIWVKKNENNIDDTNTVLQFGNNDDYKVAAWNFFLQLNAGDYIELYWMPTDPSLRILYASSPAVVPALPAIPSVILTISEI